MKRPVLQVNIEGIPQFLRDIPRWTLWTAVPEVRKDGQTAWRKVPKRANGESGSSTDPTAWLSFDEAVKAYRTGQFTGLGVILTGDDGIVGLDLDDHLHDGAPDALMRDAMTRVDGYWEISPSNAGAKCITRARGLGTRTDKAAGIEFYEDGRYFTITGHAIEGDLGNEFGADQTAALDAFLKQYLGPKARVGKPRKPPAPRPTADVDDNDDGLLAFEEHIADGEASRGIPIVDGWGIERVREELLPHLDLDDYDEWFAFVCAMHHQGGGAQEWMDFAEECSSASEKYVDGDVERRWGGLARKTHVTTLHKLLRETAEVRAAAAREKWQRLIDAVTERPAFDALIQSVAEAQFSPLDLADVKGRLVKKAKEIGLVGVNATTIGRALKVAAAEAGERNETARVIDLELEIAQRVLDDNFGGGAHLMRFGGAWWLYDGGVWRPTEQDFVESRVQASLRSIKQGGGEMARKLLELLKEAGRGEYLNALATAVTSVLRREVAQETNKDPLRLRGAAPGSVINCRNGELWFDQDTGEVEFKDHAPEHRLTSQIATHYDPRAACPRFERALDRVFSLCEEPAEMKRHWLELMGTIIQPTRPEALWVLLKGPGSNGKTFITEVIEALMGEGACFKGSIDELAAGANNHLTYSLVGKLMFFDDDLRSDTVLPDAWLKKLSEEKRLTANPKNKDAFEFVCRAAIVMLANSWPRTTDITHGMARRAHVFETGYIFGPENSDPGAKRKILAEELPGVLNLLVEGWQRVLRRGGRYDRPAECRASVQRWIENGNTSARFIGSALVRKPDAPAVLAKPLHSLYCAWAEDNGVSKRFILGRNTFYEALRAAGIPVFERHGVKYVQGVLPRVFKPENEAELSEEGRQATERIWSAAKAIEDETRGF